MDSSIVFRNEKAVCTSLLPWILTTVITGKTATARSNLAHLISEDVHYSGSSGCDSSFLSRCALATLCSRGMTGFGEIVNGFEFFVRDGTYLQKTITCRSSARPQVF